MNDGVEIIHSNMQATAINKGRGGAAFVFLSQTENSLGLLLGAGAGREEQYDDFYLVQVDKSSLKVKTISLNVKEMDGFGARHSVGAASFEGKTFLFGGQDVIAEKTLNTLHVYHKESNSLEQIEYVDGAIVPAPRNSHSTAIANDQAYFFGGANEDGPLNDAYSLDLKTGKFARLKVEDPAKCAPFEMHSSVFLEDKLLLLGGRTHVLPCD